MLYTTKTPITSANILNDRVLPFFEQQSLPMLRILTDRGTEYCGKVEQHDYQVAFRKKLYETIDELQKDLAECLQYYNNERTH